MLILPPSFSLNGPATTTTRERERERERGQRCQRDFPRTALVFANSFTCVFPLTSGFFFPKIPNPSTAAVAVIASFFFVAVGVEPPLMCVLCVSQIGFKSSLSFSSHPFTGGRGFRNHTCTEEAKQRAENWLAPAKERDERREERKSFSLQRGNSSIPPFPEGRSRRMEGGRGGEEEGGNGRNSQHTHRQSGYVGSFCKYEEVSSQQEQRESREREKCR